MDALEKLLQENLIPLQRYVHFKIQNRQDAEDIIQDVCLTAALKFDTLHSPEAFKAWLIGIARHKCLDYYRRKAAEPNISLDTLPESALRVWLGVGSPGITERSMVRDTMDSLGDKEKQIFYLFFFRNLSQKDISRKLGIPIGTAKSCLHSARNQFRSMCSPENILLLEKGRKSMPRKDHTHGFSSVMPAVSIEKSTAPFFEVRCEEQWFIIPRVGNQCAEAKYRYPDKKLVIVPNCYVPKSCLVHDVPGVKICCDHTLSGVKSYIKTKKYGLPS